MQKHTKIYLKGCGYTDTDFVKSEISPERAVDIHHIISRGKGGEDRIENLMALTREEHVNLGDKKEWMYFLLIKHHLFLLSRDVKFSQVWFDEMFTKYRDV